MRILQNAIDSIELGVEDYQTNDLRRLLSAVRNFYSGILLLFKHKLALLSHNNNEALLREKILPVEEDGVIVWKGKGNTVNFHQIQERFKNLKIAVDWNRVDGLRTYRNNVEHYYDKDTKPEVVREYIANCFIIICDFTRAQLDEDPKALFHPEIWESLLKANDVHKQDKEICSRAINSLEWPCDKTLILIDDFICTECGSDLIEPIDDLTRDATQNTFQCRMCDEEWGFSELLSLACTKEAEGDHARIAEGGDATFAYCPECSEEYYHVFDRVCVNCGAEGPYHCKLCDCEVPSCELSLYQDEGVCTWCWQVRMKDD